MLRCLGLSNKNSYEEDDAYSDEIVKTCAFNHGKPGYKRKYENAYETVICNDVDLLKLHYLGPLRVNYSSLSHIFGKPQELCCYKGSYAFELVWYIKFKDGSKGSICKSFKNSMAVNYADKWKVYGSSDLAMKNIILLLL